MAMKRQTADLIFRSDRMRLLEEAAEARLRARWLAHGAERDQLLRRARQCETGAQGALWVTSPGLQPPRRGKKG